MRESFNKHQQESLTRGGGNLEGGLEAVLKGLGVLSGGTIFPFGKDNDPVYMSEGTPKS